MNNSTARRRRRRRGEDAGGSADDAGQLRQILEALPAAIYTTDAEGRLTFFNEAAVEMAGRRPTLGSDRWCVTWQLQNIDGTPLPHDECPMAVALKKGRPVRGAEAVLERPDGTRVRFQPYPTPLFDAAGNLVGGVNMLVDITDRARGEEAKERSNQMLKRRAARRAKQAITATAQLRESEERFRMLVQGVSDYAIYMLDPDGVITNWNTGGERIKGYSADDAVGRNFSMFYTEDDRRIERPRRNLEIARTTGRFEGEGWRVRKDGSRFWAGVVIDPIHDDDGTLVGFAKVTRDLTERRAAEEQLRMAHKMEAMGQLTGGVAHDFNNLLTAIIGNLELLATALPAGDARKRFADSALRAALRGTQLTDQLLAFARRDATRTEVVEVNRVLRDTSILCQNTLGDGVSLEFDLGEGLWPCRIDAPQLQAAILNIAANARDAMNRAGGFRIRTENRRLGVGDRSGLPAGDYVVLSLTDTGCGMSEEVAARAFDPFFTTKDVGKGTGLGLSQVYGFARQSGGMARIDSREGRGTTLHLYLPRAEDEAGAVLTLPPARSTGEDPEAASTLRPTRATGRAQLAAP